MKLKNIFFLGGMILSAPAVMAQYSEDALKFSQTEQGVTSRFRALGSAQTALGGDLSSLAGNPAGLGMFTKNEFNFTADFRNNSVDGNYIGLSTNSQKDKLGFNQAGVVFHIPTFRNKGSDLTSGWLGFNFGIGYNKTNNFNSTIDYAGNNLKSSFADYVANLSDSYLNGGRQTPTHQVFTAGSLEEMAYNNYLTEYSPQGYFATTALGNRQNDTRYNGGSQSEVNFGLGANYSNQFYIGASLALSDVNFSSDRLFNEVGKTRTYPGQPADFTGGSYSLAYRSYQQTNGSGVNVKLGAIYKPADFIRIGVNFISPTWYSIKDSYAEGLDTKYNRANGSAVPAYTNNNITYNTDYTLRTPFRLNGGLALILGNGLITGDAEYVDYTSINFSGDDVATNSNMKTDIRNKFQSAINYRAGIEYKLSSILLRGGYNVVGNPYSNSTYSSKTFSGGLGYRKNNISLDLSYANAAVNYTNKPYNITSDFTDYSNTGSGETANINTTNNNVYVTLGVRF